jgi:hypothetical protein
MLEIASRYYSVNNMTVVRRQSRHWEGVRSTELEHTTRSTRDARNQRNRVCRRTTIQHLFTNRSITLDHLIVHSAAS